MIIIIQLVIISVAIFIIITALGHRDTHSGRAWKKIAIILLAMLMIISVLLPEIVDKVARSLGIGRGADLLIYSTVTAFILYVLNSYLHQQDEKDKLYRLARKIAIIEANEKYKDILKK